MESKLSALDEEEAAFAKTLLQKKMISQRDLTAYIDYRKNKDEKGKRFLGEILKEQGLITADDLKEFVDESDDLHMEFCDKLVDKGYLTEDQLETIWRRRDDTGEDVISIMEDLGIMTRDNFARIFDKNTSAGTLRMGEWMVLNKNVTNEQILAARDIQRVNTLADYLIYNKIVAKKEINKALLEMSGSIGEIINQSGIR